MSPGWQFVRKQRTVAIDCVRRAMMSSRPRPPPWHVDYGARHVGTTTLPDAKRGMMVVLI